MLALIGVTISLLGFVINLYFQRRRDRREAEFHQARLDAFAAQVRPAVPPISDS